MTTIELPPHTHSIPVTFKVSGKKQVILLEPSEYDFTLTLPENAQLFGEFGLEPMKVNSLSGLNHEKLGCFYLRNFSFELLNYLVHEVGG